jgi:hypothetical protein
MPFRTKTFAYLLASALLVAACGGDDAPTLGDYYPEVPKPTGDAQSVFAGAITTANTNELIEGPARSGLVGDYFMRNSKGRYVIQSPTRVIGVVPQGGNLVDAVPLDSAGNDDGVDHFGELSLVYVLGRTCEHREIEVVQDGSGGGAAVIRAVGVTANNDFINLRGIGVLNVTLELDPDIEDGLECATTYVLEPDSTRLEVYWTLFNPTDIDIKGPMGALNDSGGDTESWAPTRGFERLGISALTSAGDPAPVDYVLYQGPDVAYGVIPRHTDPTVTNSTFLVAGVSILLLGAENLLDILNDDAFFLDLKAGKGFTFGMEVSVGHDAADVEEDFRVGADEAVAELSGTVAWAVGSGSPSGARVGVWEDGNGDGQIDEENDVIRTYMDVAADGTFSGKLLPGNYLLRADVTDVSRSAVVSTNLTASGTSGVALTLPDPVWYDYEIIDDETGNNIPGKLQILGRHPIEPEQATQRTYDRLSGLVRAIRSIRGTTTDMGSGADPRFALPAGGTYRIFVSRGTEWSMTSQVVTPTAGDPDQTLTFRLRRVAPATGYVSSEYHVHSVGSPDSPVLYEDRVATMLADGVELFASTEHDYISDIQPVIESMGVERDVRVIPGIEVTPFAYGHFNAWPMQPNNDSANHGAIDWARGTEGFAMIPGEIFSAMRDRGAELVQVNHPRSGAGDAFGFQQFFDRAGLAFDYATRVISTDSLRIPVPMEWLRLPETSLFSDQFNALEVWNGFSTTDSNGDGVRELSRLDIVTRDWFNFLSFGLDVVPLGNSDTHTIVKDPAGMPRTYVRVSDDSPTALANGNIVADVVDTLAGRNNTPRDVVVTNGPHIMVQANGDSAPLGKVLTPSSNTVQFEITVIAPEWAEFDTIEIFANATPATGDDIESSALNPLACFTSRTGLMGNDTCGNAPLGGARAMTVELKDVGSGYNRWEATVSITIAATDIMNRTGATGSDAWFVIRAYGQKAIFPILMNDVLSQATVDTLVSGTSGEVDTLLRGAGVPAVAFTAPIFVDFDGGGYTAVFSPQ